MKIYNLIVLSLLMICCSSLQAQHKDSIAVMKTMNRFVYAFNNFEWEIFRNCFADDATMFGGPINRITGRTEIEAFWLKLTPQFSPDSVNKKPRNVTPQDINVQLFRKAAIVTFYRRDEIQSVGRRTFVLIKRKGEWKIAHLHASNISEN